MKTKILYISYNGMNEPLGASQVLSYLYKLSDNYEYHLVSLEKPKDFADTEKMEGLRKKLSSHGILWYPVRYKTDRMGKLTNFFRLLKKVNAVSKKHKITNAHCRSYFPAMIAYLLKL